MSAHTLGPWRKGTCCHSIVANSLPDGAMSGSEDITHYGGYLVAESVAPCNVPLIAAAPDLLEALRAVEALVTGSQYEWHELPPTHNRAKLLATIRAALAKAQS